MVKFGADVNHLPLTADFTVNFGGVYNFGEISPGAFGLPTTFGGRTVPNFSPVQAYGLGVPQVRSSAQRSRTSGRAFTSKSVTKLL